MLTIEELKVPKSSKIYSCELCHYTSSRCSQYERHLLTAKHKKMEKSSKNVDILAKNVDNLLTEDKKSSKKSGIKGKYICFCGKAYNHRQSLSVHKKMCVYEQPMSSGNTQVITTELVMELIKQNKNLQDMLSEQHSKMYEIAKEGKIINTNNNNNNNTTNNNTTNNNHFNLNVFLNETCKDAINMTDFIDSLNVKLKDLEYTAKTSYAEGISKIFINGLSSLNVPDRPIHCSDSKRDIIYIKDQDAWEKDDENKTKLTRAIKLVGHKNMKQISEWQKAYPDYNNPDSKQNDHYMKMLCNAMCGSTKEETEKNYEKIIKNIVKEVVIDKDMYR